MKLFKKKLEGFVVMEELGGLVAFRDDVLGELNGLHVHYGKLKKPTTGLKYGLVISGDRKVAKEWSNKHLKKSNPKGK